MGHLSKYGCRLVKTQEIVNGRCVKYPDEIEEEKKTKEIKETVKKIRELYGLCTDFLL